MPSTITQKPTDALGLADPARACFVEFLDSQGLPIGRHSTSWSGGAFLVNATTAEVAAAATLRFSDVAGQDLGCLGVIRPAQEHAVGSLDH